MYENKLFDFDYTAGWIRIPKCENCGQEFSNVNLRKYVAYEKIADKTNPQYRDTSFQFARRPLPPVYRRPMLLDCMHNVCENCCWKAHGPIKCNKCQAVTPIIKHKAIRESIENNYYLCGLLNYIELILPCDMEYSNTFLKKNKITDQHECSECNKEKTNFFCVQCAVPYCISCFKSVHRFGKTLKKHCMAPLGSAYFSKMELKTCPLHRRGILNYCSDCHETCCLDCITESHKTHATKTIAEENPKLLPKIKSLIETLKSAKNYNRQAQKDARFIEKKQEEYASKAVNEVSKYFMDLHATLQIVQRKILLDIKKHSSTLLIETKQAQETLKKSLETIDEISCNLENILGNCPVNFMLSELIERTNTILETTPCNLQFEGCDENPFKLEDLGDPLAEFKKLNKFNFNANEFSIKIMTFFGDTSFCSEEDILANRLEELSVGLNLNKTQIIPVTMQPPSAHIAGTSQSSSAPVKIKKRKHPVPALSKYNMQKVHVSHIKNPEQFYVQNQSFLAASDDFKVTCTEEGDFGATPDEINMEDMYLVFNTLDRFWYRGKVLSVIKPEFYKVFLIDYGNCMDVPKQRFRVISDDLQSRPPGAINCSLYGIKPKEENWTDEANHLMSDIIKTQIVNMLTIKEGDPQLVEILTTHLQYPTPVRDTLLFHNLAEIDTVNQELNKKISQISQITRNSLIVNTSRYYKNVFKEKESFRGIVTNIINPQEFYVAKYDHKKLLDDLYVQLNEDYQKSYETIYYPQENMVCAVFVEGIWYRARIAKILDKGKCRVWLVDYGRHEDISSRQIRILDDKYISANECVIQCSLIDIEPLQENDYSWTEAAIADFNRFILNANLLIFIHHSKDFHYKVVINISKQYKDVNVNALLVKHKHAISTGMESIQVDFPKKEAMQSIGSPEEYDCSMNKSKGKAELRTRVKITCIVSPGEFYVNINKQIPGILKLHEQFQEFGEAQKNVTESMTLAEIKQKFTVDSTCLVKVSLKKDSTAEWYRARILGIDDSDGTLEYKVFLRDNGRVISKIPLEKIVSIIPEYDRICNGAIKCHMACVQPTGGVDKWSASSIDEFRLIVIHYEAISISKQGEYTDSFPMIVWGLTSECSDPFAPTINKWFNINKILVNRGLLHLVEKFAPVMKADISIDIEGQNALMGIDEWVEKFNTSKTKIKEELDETVDKSLQSFEFTNEFETITEWIPPVLLEKTLFIGIPTYVDENAVIYLHDTHQKKVLDKIKSVINDMLSEEDEPAHELYWYAGQPCLARFHGDRLFYRAVVIQTLPEKVIKVQFIDYGNIEEYSMSELRKDVMLGNVPMQATKFSIGGIRPKKGSKYSTAILDFIHSKIVDKSCSIRVADDQENCEIKRCSLKVGSEDIAEVLIEMGYADRGSSSIKYTQISNTILRQKENENDLDIVAKNESPPVEENDILDSDKLRKYFEQKELNDLYNSIIINDNSSDSEDIDNCDLTFRSGFWKKRSDEEEMGGIELDEEDEHSSSMNSFNPRDTSSVKSQLCQTQITNIFKATKIPHETKGFYCEINYVKDPLNFLVCPQIQEHLLKQKQMTKELQIQGKIGHRFKDIEKNAPCLAIYHEDNLWYRALFRSYCQNVQKLDIVFVDFLNAEQVDPSMVKKCPQTLLEYPLRNIQVRLSKVKINTRWRKSDVEKQMVDAIRNKSKVYAKIIKNGTIPEVELYNSHLDTEVIYDSLIVNKFLLSEN